MSLIHLLAADVQAYLNGVESPVFKNFFTVKTFVAKVIGSSLAVGSSLVMVSQCAVHARAAEYYKWQQLQAEDAGRVLTGCASEPEGYDCPAASCLH
jgi:hypothetical protein